MMRGGLANWRFKGSEIFFTILLVGSFIPYQVMIYPLVIGTIIAQWQVAPSSAGFAVTATLLASAVGGWAAGIDAVGGPVLGFFPGTSISNFSRPQAVAFMERARATLGTGFCHHPHAVPCKVELLAAHGH